MGGASPALPCVARCCLTVVWGSREEQSGLRGLLLLFSVNKSSDTGLVSFCQALLWVIGDVLVTTNHYFAINIYSVLPTEQKFTWVLPVLLQAHRPVAHSTFLQ